MKNSLSLPRLLVVGAFGMLIAFCIPMSGQEATLQKGASASKEASAPDEALRHNIEDWIHEGRGMPEDWSHHHLIFSNPGTEDEAMANGTHDLWLNIVNHPRYILQQINRNPMLRPAPEESTYAKENAPAVTENQAVRNDKPKLKKDWSVTLGAGLVNPNTYPAKFSFSTNAASCTSDYVVYPTGTAGSSSQATIVAYNELYSGSTGSGGCGTSGIPAVYWAYNTGSATVTSSPIFSYDTTGSQVAFVQVSSSVWRSTSAARGFSVNTRSYNRTS